YILFFYFFFQAEDGIRDGHVTGVQTCALPIYSEKSLAAKKQNQLSCFSRQQLLDYRDQLRLKQEFNRLPASDLKQKLARFRESEARMASNALPEEWSASRLKGNVELLKHACRRFGVEAVNARLRGES